MNKSIWAFVAAFFMITVTSVFGAEAPSHSLPHQKVQAKEKQAEEQDIESGCEERFNPYNLHYSDTAEQDICTT